MHVDSPTKKNWLIMIRRTQNKPIEALKTANETCKQSISMSKYYVADCLRFYKGVHTWADLIHSDRCQVDKDCMNQ